VALHELRRPNPDTLLPSRLWRVRAGVTTSSICDKLKEL
jgi:hypothetical protein